MAGRDPTVIEIVRAELQQPVAAPVQAVTEEIARRHGAALVACLFYGSCLRDGVVEERVLDFYAVTEDYRAFHGSRLAAAGNALLPPNVYYLETEYDGAVIRAKYAVLSVRHLRRDTSARAFQPALWGRLAQPCALVHARDPDIAELVAESLASAAATMVRETAPLLPAGVASRSLWVRAFAESYRTEFRAELSGQPLNLYKSFPERYDRIAFAVLRDFAPGKGPGGAARRWWARRVFGKVFHVLRLAKAAYTFTGGLDYILWKIESHSGVRAEPTAWQRRHPLMAAPGLAWRLYRRGAFR